MKSVYVFTGQSGRFPGAIFSTKENIIGWIKLHSLSGVLTEYPLDVGVADWLVDNNYIKRSSYGKLTPDHMASYSAHLDHWHFENGESKDDVER